MSATISDEGPSVTNPEKTPEFNYKEAFSRNIGWVTEEEQMKLRNSTVAIAGMGGVGGAHAITLARLGIGHFRIADFDHFEVPNFNRQPGAKMSTLNKPKVSVIASMVRDINPEVVIEEYPAGVDESNIVKFLEGASVYVDSLDFFALEARQMVFRECHRLGIPALTAAPVGMGVAFMHFSPKGMSFEEYFQMKGQSENEQLVRFMAGVSPSMLQRGYLAAPQAVDFAKHKAPSTKMGIDLCAGVMGVETLKVLLGRGKVRPCPHGYHFDAYRQKLKRTYRPFGNSNPIQKVLIALIRATLNGKGESTA